MPTRKAAIPAPSEHNEQSVFVDRVLYEYRSQSDFSRPLFFATLNGVWIAGRDYRRKMALIMKYKREGWVNGVADLLYLQPRGRYAYLAIEMKTGARAKEKYGGASEDQLEWLQAAKAAGAMAAVCHGADAAFDTFRLYMALDARMPVPSDE